MKQKTLTFHYDDDLLKKEMARIDRRIIAEQLADPLSYNYDTCKLHIEMTGKPYAGAIGGGLTWKITGTSVGTVVKVLYWGEEIDLSGYENW